MLTSLRLLITIGLGLTNGYFFMYCLTGLFSDDEDEY